MFNYQYSNPKGQDVGYVQNEIFYCVRNAHKNEVFKYKKYFNEIYINNAIAIQKNILDSLIKNGIRFIQATIVGIEEHSFRKYIETRIIKERGQLMCFDKNNPQGWGWQYIFSYEWGSDTLQIKLRDNS